MGLTTHGKSTSQCAHLEHSDGRRDRVRLFVIVRDCSGNLEDHSDAIGNAVLQTEPEQRVSVGVRQMSLLVGRATTRLAEERRLESRPCISYGMRPAMKNVVLVIEDDINIVEILTLYPSGSDYEVKTAADGEQALEIVDSENVSVVLVDIKMPKMNGYDFIKNVRTFCDVPIIILSARNQPTDKILGLDLGADGYNITKALRPPGGDRLYRGGIAPTPCNCRFESRRWRRHEHGLVSGRREKRDGAHIEHSPEAGRRSVKPNPYQDGPRAGISV